MCRTHCLVAKPRLIKGVAGCIRDNERVLGQRIWELSCVFAVYKIHFLDAFRGFFRVRQIYYTFCFSKVLKYFQHYFCFLTGTVHFERFGKRYHLSWLEEGLDKKFTWTGARNYCRRFCMDSITFNSKREYQFFKRLISDGKISQIKIKIEAIHYT